MAENWIQNLNLKKGALHRQLGIPEDQKIPMSLIEKILLCKPGDVVEYTVNGKKKRIKVTKKLLARARLAKVFKQIARRRKGEG